MPHDYTCSSCGAPGESRQPNTETCTLCRVLRDVLALQENPAECRDCGRAFLRSYRGQRSCPTCDIDLFGDGAVPPPGRASNPRNAGYRRDSRPCAICDRASSPEAPRVHPALALCVGCVAAPENADTVRAAARAKLRRQRAKVTA